MEEKARRDAFNMRVLKRQDPQIVDIVGSAAFVVLYELDGEWTKLGIEGPMFLYRRSVAPKYGFSVLNRNGIENYTANLTKDDDLELTDEFVIYRAQSDEQVLGIWIYDAQERISVGKTMSKLHDDTFLPSTSSIATPQIAAMPPAPSITHQAGQRISLDALFGTAQAPHPQAQAQAQAQPTGLTGSDLLNSLFQSATVTAPPQQSTNGVRDPSRADRSADDLKALLGLSPNNVHAPSAPAAPTRTTGDVVDPSSHQLPQGLETIFASARIGNQQSPASKTVPQVPSGASSNFANHTPAAKALDDTLAGIATLSPALDRRDFVREVLSLIHTDKDFVDALYQNYLARVQ